MGRGSWVKNNVFFPISAMAGIDIPGCIDKVKGARNKLFRGNRRSCSVSHVCESRKKKMVRI